MKKKLLCQILPAAILITILSLSSCLSTGEPNGENPSDILINSSTKAIATTEPTNIDSKSVQNGVSADITEEATDVILENNRPPLNNTEFRNKLISMMPWNMSAVRDGASPLVIVHDLDKNGYNDALVVAIEDSNGASFILDDLSQTSRLFQSGLEYSNFVLLIFYQYSDDVVLRYTVPVANQLVFNGVNLFEVKKGSDFPYALEFSFRTKAGIEKELIILSGHGVTRFTIHENLSEITLIDDIDEDGYEDIIVHEQGFEEGTGFETFLSWYKWNSREYTEYKTTNIVRNLKQFYAVCTEYLRAGEYGRFLEYAIDSEALSALKKQELSEAEILERIFLPVDSSEVEHADFFNAEGFYTVVFPEIMETPFSYANRMDFRHEVTVRFRPIGGASQIFLAQLRMKKNPFQTRQFCFCVDANQGALIE